MDTSNNLLKPEHVKAICSLSEETNCPVEKVTEVYAVVLADFSSSAQLHDYLAVLTSKKVRYMLRQSKVRVDGGV